MGIDDGIVDFSPETLALIAEYQRTRSPALVKPVLRGIVEKYMPEGGSVSALGLESLALVQAVLDIEEALGVSLSDDEWRQVRTFEEAGELLERRVRGIL